MMKLFYFVLMILFIGNYTYSQADSTKYYSAVVKDTFSLCDNSRTIAFNYLIGKIKKKHNQEKWIKKYLGVEMLSKKDGNTVYKYGLKCGCASNETGKRSVSVFSCDFIALEIKKRKIYKIYYSSTPM